MNIFENVYQVTRIRYFDALPLGILPFINYIHRPTYDNLIFRVCAIANETKRIFKAFINFHHSYFIYFGMQRYSHVYICSRVPTIFRKKKQKIPKHCVVVYVLSVRLLVLIIYYICHTFRVECAAICTPPNWTMSSERATMRMRLGQGHVWLCSKYAYHTNDVK